MGHIPIVLSSEVHGEKTLTKGRSQIKIKACEPLRVEKSRDFFRFEVLMSKQYNECRRDKNKEMLLILYLNTTPL